MEWGRSLEEKAHLRVDRLIPGVSERIKRACRNYNVRVVYRSGPDTANQHEGSSFSVKTQTLCPCECGKVYVGD